MILIMKNPMKKKEKILITVGEGRNGSYWKGTEEMLIFYVTF